MPTTLEQHAQELKRLAVALVQSAEVHFRDWTDVFYEVCNGNDDNAVARTIVRNMSGRDDVHPRSEVNDCMATLLDLRTQLPGDKWRCLSICTF